MHDVYEPIDLDNVRELSDLGAAPADRRTRTAWVRKRLVEIGVVWYATGVKDRHRQGELEDLAVAFLKAHPDDLPTLATLKREVANWSFLPSVVDELWARAFPPTNDELAQGTAESQVLDRTVARIAALRESGAASEAEALRRAAVSFFKKHLTDSDLDEVLRKRALRLLRKP